MVEISKQGRRLRDVVDEERRLRSKKDRKAAKDSVRPPALPFNDDDIPQEVYASSPDEVDASPPDDIEPPVDVEIPDEIDAPVNEVPDDTNPDDDGEDNIFEPPTGSMEVINSEDDFVVYCQSELVSFEMASDGLISQDDVAMFATDICDILDEEDLPAFSCPTPEFANLDVAIQLSFVSFICPNDDQVELLNCLATNSISGEEFGYEINADTFEQARSSVMGFCCSMIPFLDLTGITPLTNPDVCPTDLPNVDIGTSSSSPAGRTTPGSTSTQGDGVDGTTPSGAFVVVDSPPASESKADSKLLSFGIISGLFAVLAVLSIIPLVIVAKRRRKLQKGEVTLG